MDKDIIDYDDIENLKLYEDKEPKKELPIDNKKLYEEFVIYKKMCQEAEEKGKERPQLTRFIAESIIKIANLTSYINTNNNNFLRYTNNWKEDMILDAIEICNRYVHNFDPEQSKNPFSYIQTFVINSFKQRLKKEHLQLYYRYKMYVDINGFSAYFEDDEYSNENIKEFETNYATDTAEDFIQRFEDKRNSEKEKYKANKKSNLNKNRITINDFIQDEKEDKE